MALRCLQSGPLASVPSVIVYVTFQRSADEVAKYLKDNGVSAVSYHAGKHMRVSLDL